MKYNNLILLIIIFLTFLNDFNQTNDENLLKILQVLANPYFIDKNMKNKYYNEDEKKLKELIQSISILSNNIDKLNKPRQNISKNSNNNPFNDTLQINNLKLNDDKNFDYEHKSNYMNMMNSYHQLNNQIKINDEQNKDRKLANQYDYSKNIDENKFTYNKSQQKERNIDEIVHRVNDIYKDNMITNEKKSDLNVHKNTNIDDKNSSLKKEINKDNLSKKNNEIDKPKDQINYINNDGIKKGEIKKGEIKKGEINNEGIKKGEIIKGDINNDGIIKGEIKKGEIKKGEINNEGIKKRDINNDGINKEEIIKGDINNDGINKGEINNEGIKNLVIKKVHDENYIKLSSKFEDILKLNNIKLDSDYITKFKKIWKILEPFLYELISHYNYYTYKIQLDELKDSIKYISDFISSYGDKNIISHIIESNKKNSKVKSDLNVKEVTFDIDLNKVQKNLILEIYKSQMIKEQELFLFRFKLFQEESGLDNLEKVMDKLELSKNSLKKYFNKDDLINL